MDHTGFFFDNNIRIEEMIWIASNYDQPGERIEEFFDDMESMKDLEEVFGKLPFRYSKKKLDKLRESKYLALISELCQLGKDKFLVQASVPIPVNVDKDNNPTTYGFGYIQFKWFYAEVIDESFFARLLAWKKKFYTSRFKKLRKEKEKAKALK